MRTLSLFAFIFFFGLSGLGVFLAERLVRSRGQAFLRSYSRHLALWDGHALVQIMQFILGSKFLPAESWAPFGTIMAPFVFLFLGASLYFLILFAAQLAGRRLPRLLSIIYIGLWAGVLVVYALAAGDGPSAPDPSARAFFSIAFFLLKTGTVLAVTGSLLVAAAGAKDKIEGRSLRAVAGTYLAGFLLFQLSVGGQIPLARLPGHDFWLALIQIGFHFPVLAALAAYASRRAAAGSSVLFPSAAPEALESTGLTSREAEIVGLVMRGFSNKEIEARLFISLETVKKHLSSIYRKLGVKNRLQLSLAMQKKA
ncbi:MAG TPA: helix-turn-helix transcriptional regulator [Acidobacteriota bacterium]|nr:helix-turn-helix transcriptional regulator [Acidobacteriota bacterium]